MSHLKTTAVTAEQSNNRVIEKSKNLRRAFTMIELMVVIGILGILMAVLLGTFGGSTESARAAKCQSNMRSLAMAVQSVAMANEHYPYAGSFEKYAAEENGKRGTTIAQGWIGSNSASYGSPYVANKDSYEETLEKGSIWTSMKGSRESYVCPTHVNYAKDKRLGTPMWSYAMSAYFYWASKSNPRSRNFTGRYYRSFRRADRYLLFAEIPLDSSNGADKKNDPVLQYQNCDGGGDEEIGFNHKDGNTYVAHVCFVDGHVEKLRQPKSGNVKELTEWLCHPADKNGDFDVTFDGKEYKKSTQSN